VEATRRIWGAAVASATAAAAALRRLGRTDRHHHLIPRQAIGASSMPARQDRAGCGRQIS
jgi:hypothetical protein